MAGLCVEERPEKLLMLYNKVHYEGTMGEAVEESDNNTNKEAWKTNQ